MIWALLGLIACIVLFGWWGILVFVGMVAIFVIAISADKKIKEKQSQPKTSPIKNYSNFTPKSISKEQSDSIDREVEDSLRRIELYGIEAETERLRAENEKWGAISSVIMSNRHKAKDLEKEAKLREALNTYKQNIEFAINNGFDFCNYAHDIERVVILLGKLKEHQELSATLTHLIEEYPNVSNSQNWRAKLAKLSTGKVNYSINIAIGDIGIIKPSNPTIGQKIRDAKAKLPEFNFYFDMPSGMETFQYLAFQPVLSHEVTHEYRELNATVKAFIGEANVAEKAGDYLTAIRCYEKLIIEECEEVEPYNRLIVIYGKLKWTTKVRETLVRGIDFFSNLSQEQKRYVLSLAAKYGMTGKAMEYIDSNKPIYYYAGLFQLYNSYSTVLVKWQAKLSKLSI